MKFQFNIDLIDNNFRNFITYNTAAVSGQLGAGLSAARNLLRIRYKI